MIKTLIYTPDLTHYRLKVYNNIAKKVNLTVVYNYNNNFKRDGFFKGSINKKIKFIKSLKFNFLFFYFQSNIVFNILRNNYKVIIISSDVKNITNYLVIIICKLFKKKIYLWGQGAFNKNFNYFYIKFIYFIYHKFLDLFITKYVCYNKICSNHLKNVIRPNKIKIINNTLEKNINITKKNKNLSSIIFIGRLRRNNALELLILALNEINKKFKNIKLKIVGSGENYKRLKKMVRKYNINCKFYKMTDNFKDLTKDVFAGVYPGSAGLSVVDYLLLGLPVITHKDFLYHMGPEPYYLKHNYNSLIFRRNSYTDLADKILAIYKNKSLYKRLSKNSILTGKKLNQIPLSQKFINLIYEN